MKKVLELNRRCYRCLEKAPDVFQHLESKYSMVIKLFEKVRRCYIQVHGKDEQFERGLRELEDILIELKKKEEVTYSIHEGQLEKFRNEHPEINFSEVALLEGEKKSSSIKVSAFGRRFDLLYFERVQDLRGVGISDVASTVGFREVENSSLIGGSESVASTNVFKNVDTFLPGSETESVASTNVFKNVNSTLLGNLNDEQSVTSSVVFNEVRTEMNISEVEDEENEGEEEGENGSVDAFSLLSNGLRNITSKERLPLPKETRICVVGRVSCGKSSLINHMISADKRRVYVCPSGAMTCTRSVSEHRYCEGRVNEDLERMFLRKGNEQQGKTVLKVKTIKNKLLQNAIVVDTPGLNDYFELVEKPNRIVDEEKEGVRKEIENQVKSSDVVLFLVGPPDLEDDETISRTLARIVELQSNVIVVLTKFDQLFDSDIPGIERTHGEETAEKNCNRALKIMENFSKKFDLFGCFVCFSQVHEPVDGETGPYFFSDELVYDAIYGMKFPPKDSMIHVRSQLRKAIQSSHHAWIPMEYYANFKKKKNLRKKKKAVIGGGAVAGAAGLFGAAIFAVGSVLVVGGIMAQVVPGLGTGAGAVSITTGLAALGVGGTGMVGGITVLTGIGASVGAASAIFGGTIFVGLAVANDMIVAKYVAKLPLSARMTMSLFHEGACKFISERLVEKKEWKKVMEYEKRSHIKKDSMLEKYFGKYEEWKEYVDSVIIQYEDVWYCVTGVFRGPFLVHVRDVLRISPGE